MEIKINKEIRDYKESIFFGLSFRQFFFSVIAVIVAVLLYFILRNFMGLETVSWLCILGAIPFAAFGFFRYNGMYLEEFIVAWVRSEILTPKVLLFKPENIYDEMLKEHNKKLKKEAMKDDVLVQQKKKKDKESVKIPRSVQQAIPIKRIYEDGIFEIRHNVYSKSFKFTDINYAVASPDEQEEMFIKYGDILSMLDEGVDSKITIINRKLNKIDFDKKIKLAIEDDRLAKYREEYNKILSNSSSETNGIIQEKIITITIDKPNIESARKSFSKTATNLQTCFSQLGSICEELDIKERLRVFYDFYRVGEEDVYYFDIKEFMKKGHSFKDYICPDTFEFKKDYFKMGDRYGRVLYLKEYATFLKDDIASELTDLNRNMMLSIDINPMTTDAALKLVEGKRLGVEKNIADWQRRQNEHNNFSAIIPYEFEQQREVIKDMLNDITNRNQKLFVCNLIIAHTADSKEELDSDTETIITNARKRLCQVVTLKYQQMDGLNTVMPSGTKRIKTNRTLTTESLSTFMPFKVQEVQDTNGIYYGQNVISKNMILIDRKKLQNGNSFILGVSGSGKSFTAKQEITSIALRDKNADIIILDPEAEYRPLVESLGGQVVKISSTSSNHINALELNKNYGYDDEDEKREKDPIVAKSEFMLSLCMQIMQEQNVNPYKKTIIDRCSKLVYEDYKNRNYTGEPPTLNDFREILLQQKEKEAKEIALALELFTKGSLNTFASQTNIEINNRILCYDINSLGDNLRPVGMLVLLDNILNRISLNRQKGKSTYIFIDEIYLLFRYSYTAEFIEKLWKRIRKYGGFATGITQNIQEVLASSTASIMLSNSELLIMLNQSAIDGDLLAENLKLSDMEKSYITNVSSGEGLIKVKNSFIPFKNKFPKDTELYKLMTTKLSDLKNNS